MDTLSFWVRQKLLFVFTVKQSHLISTRSFHVLMFVSKRSQTCTIVTHPHNKLLVIELQTTKVESSQKLRAHFVIRILTSCISVIVGYKPWVSKYLLFFFRCSIKPLIWLALQSFLFKKLYSDCKCSLVHNLIF